MSPFLLAAGGLTLAAILALLWPLLRRPMVKPGEAAEIAIVRDQLKELERDRLRGLIRVDEAAAARVEIERRLLRAAAAVETAAPVGHGGGKMLVATALLVPLLSAGLYFRLGAPTLPDQPLATRASEPTAVAGGPDIEAMVARLEDRLREAPDDVAGWLMLGRSRAALGDPQAALAAFRRAQSLVPDDARIGADIAEQLIVEAGGTVTPEARTLLEQAVGVDAMDPRADFYLGLAAAQRGEAGAAAERWRALLDQAPADAPWREQVVAAIRAAEEEFGVPRRTLPDRTAPVAAASPAAGVTPSDVEAMTPEARVAFIRSMVERLESRLEGDGSEPEGWQRLAQARLVLGEQEAARRAFERGLELFPDDTALLKGYAGLHVDAAASPDGLPSVSEEAARLYERVAAVAPDDPEAQWFLGIRALQAGRRDEARTHWRKVLAGLQPGDPEYAVVKRQLDSLGS